MHARLRQPIEPTDDWQQLRLLTTSAEQLTYELIRPVVLFGQSPSERARETSAPARTLYRQAARFAQHGMASLFPAPTDPHRRVPVEIRQAICELYAEYPAFRPNEIATICHVRFGYHPDPRTVRRVLAEDSAAERTTRRYPPYRAIPDPAERRLAIICLHSEGWNKQSIAGYLETSRETVHTTLRRWVEEGVAGLDDKSRARPAGVRRVDLRTILTVRELQENPELGAFRIHAALKHLGIELSPRTCGRILEQNRALYDAPKPPHEPKIMPFQAQRRHQYWTVDIRYLDHGLDGGKVCCISVIENFSRAIFASAISRRQDLGAYLMVLYAAIHQHGAPEMLISDRGSVFLATQAPCLRRVGHHQAEDRPTPTVAVLH